MNFIMFGGTMLIVLASWGMTVWCILEAPIMAGGFTLASCLCTFSWIRFVKRSKAMQRLNKIS